MRVLTDKEGYVLSFATIGELNDGIEVPNPKDMLHFFEFQQSYRLCDGILSYDDANAKALNKRQATDEYRRLREKECFPVINRGQLWYETLTADQVLELRTWYRAWLDGTEELTIPEKPLWLV